MPKDHPQALPSLEAEPIPPIAMDRREFLRFTTAAAAATALASAGCQMPAENVVPSAERPEELRRLGKPLFYATILGDRPALVRTREGRPILISGNPGHPTASTPTMRSQAALLDLYDPDRATGPLSVRRGRGLPVPTGWDEVLKELVATGRNGGETDGKRIALLARPVTGPVTSLALDELVRRTGLRVVTYAPLERESTIRAWNVCFDAPEPRLRLDRAKLLVGFGADFLDHPRADEPALFARGREPEPPGGMSRFVAFEGRLSLTGAAADERVRLRPSQLPRLARALLHEIAIQRGVGPLGASAELQAALGPQDLAETARSLGIEDSRLHALADALVANAGRVLLLTGETVCAQPDGLALGVAVHLLNLSLGAWGATLEATGGPPPRAGSWEALAALAEDLRGGRVDLLLIGGVNPVYDAPASLDFAEAMARVPRILSFNDRVDETSALADLLAPVSHALEAWGDGLASGAVFGIQQPAIRPLHDTRGWLDLLVAWGAALEPEGRLGRAMTFSRDQGVTPARVHSPAWHLLRETLRERGLGARGRFEDAWNALLRDGFVHEAPGDGVTPTLRPTAFAPLASTPTSPPALELQLFPDHALYDGACNNNGWLQEFPDPLTRISWSDWLAIAPRRFDAMGLQNGDLVEIAFNGQKFILPAYRQAGMHVDVVAAPLGFGRRAVGQVGDDVGVNLFPAVPLEQGRPLLAALEVTLRATGEHRPLPLYQGSEVIDRKARPLVPATTLSAWRGNPRAGTEQTPGGPSGWPDHPYPKQRWAMVIDLSRCTGCGLCTVACRGENNIPVVGRQGCVDRREMSWLRIDRYYDTPERAGAWPDSVWDGPLEVVEEPRPLFEPMLCQHCENAPCETVCPFSATMHSSDGLNQQVYNRCVGTFFCANNCPFKVRRFNWYDYSVQRTNALFVRLVPILREHGKLNARARLQMKNNPEVTVRSRGVMEKCSFCVQRIREARELAAVEGRDPDLLVDGEVRPACMEACPSGAIVFGNVNDPASRVAALAAKPRAMKLLEILQIRPSISYLAKVRNDENT